MNQDRKTFRRPTEDFKSFQEKEKEKIIYGRKTGDKSETLESNRNARRKVDDKMIGMGYFTRHLDVYNP